MFNEKAKSTDMVASGVRVDPVLRSRAGAGGVFHFKCYDKDGNLKWEESNHNLVVNVGLKDMNDKYFSGSTYSATWYLGLITGPAASTTFAAGDTAFSHTGWTENTDYSSGRKAITFGTPTTATPSVTTGTSSVFTMTGSATIAGAFVTNASSGTSGVLFAEGDFTGGDKSVTTGDTLAVTYTFSLTSS